MPRLLQLPENTSIPLPETGEFILGRSLECTHVIPDISVSRKHCKIFKKDSKWYFNDLSANGMFINDSKVVTRGDIALKHNDLLQLGKSVFCYKTNMPSDDADYTNAEVIVIDDSMEIDNIVEVETETAQAPAAPAPQELQTAAQKAADEATATAFDDELTCSICAELFIEAVTLNCQHSFCSLCILKWRENNKNCPICRNIITSQFPCLTINNMVSLLTAKKPQQEQDAHNAAIAARKIETEKFLAPAPQPQAANRGRGRIVLTGIVRGRGRGRGNVRQTAATRARGTPRRNVRTRANEVINLNISESDEDEEGDFINMGYVYSILNRLS